MKMVTHLFEFGLVLGLLAVASNPSPFYAALGLVWAAGAGCLLLVEGVTFLSLILFLVYLGGMMVVFAYSAALVAEPYPEAWGSSGVVVYFMVYGSLLCVWYLLGEAVGLVNNLRGSDVVLMDWSGVSFLFSSGGWILLVLGWALLLTLIVVLEVVRGHYSGVLRAVS